MSYWVLITRELPQEQAHVSIGPFETFDKANLYQNSSDDVDYICQVDVIDCFAASDDEKQNWLFNIGKDPWIQLFPITTPTSKKLTEKRKPK